MNTDFEFYFILKAGRNSAIEEAKGITDKNYEMFLEAEIKAYDNEIDMELKYLENVKGVDCTTIKNSDEEFLTWLERQN